MCAFDITQMQGEGSDELDTGSTMPLIKIIQTLSPEVNPAHAEHEKRKIEGATAGDIVFAPTEKILPQPITMLPLAQTSIYSEWRPQDSGGGFIAYHPLNIVSDSRYERVKNEEFLGDNELLYTIYLLMLMKIGDEWVRGMLSAQKTQLSEIRDLNKNISRFRYEDKPDMVPPIFARTMDVSSYLRKKNQHSWFAWKIEPQRVLDLEADEELLMTAWNSRKEAVQDLPAPGAAADSEPKLVTDGPQPF